VPKAKQPRKDKIEAPEKKPVIIHKDGNFREIFKRIDRKVRKEFTQMLKRKFVYHREHKEFHNAAQSFMFII
jgi:DNA-binding cell septation regulator SpoVG